MCTDHGVSIFGHIERRLLLGTLATCTSLNVNRQTFTRINFAERLICFFIGVGHTRSNILESGFIFGWGGSSA